MSSSFSAPSSGSYSWTAVWLRNRNLKKIANWRGMDEYTDMSTCGIMYETMAHLREPTALYVNHAMEINGKMILVCVYMHDL